MQTFVKHTGYKSYKGGKQAKGLKSIKSHIKYMENRKNEQGERENRELFTKDGTTTRKEFYELLNKQEQRGVIAHKLVISMDRKDYEAQKIDIKELTRDTMSAYEAKTGRSLKWIATFHNKESNPHVHIVVAGRDEQGKEVTFMKPQLNNLKRIADKERQAQQERNAERGLEPARDFDPMQQLAHERDMEQTLSKDKELTRDITKSRDREMIRDLER